MLIVAPVGMLVGRRSGGCVPGYFEIDHGGTEPIGPNWRFLSMNPVDSVLLPSKRLN